MKSYMHKLSKMKPPQSQNGCQGICIPTSFCCSKQKAGSIARS